MVVSEMADLKAYSSGSGYWTIFNLLAPVVSRQGKPIGNMVVEKEELNSKKLRWKFEEMSINFAKAPLPKSGFSLQLLTIETWN